MANKLLLSTLAIVSSINLANASGPKEITYPVDIVAGGTLNLKSSTTGYNFKKACNVESIYAAHEAILSATNDVTYDNVFSARGNAVLSYGNVTFDGGLTLAAENDIIPTMTVSGNMIITGSGTVDTGSSTINFTGEASELDLSSAYSTTFTKLQAAGKDAGNKLTINYGTTDVVRGDYSTYRTNLTSILSNMKFTNAKIQNIWVTGNTVKGEGDRGERLKTELKADNSGYNISIEHLEPNVDAGDITREGEKFIDKTLSDKLESAGITVVNASSNNDIADIPEEAGEEYSVNFGADMNKNTDGVTPNTAGNVFIDWPDGATYDLDSIASSTATSYTFNLDIKPDSAKTIKLTSTNTKLNTVIFNGEQNSNLTVSLNSTTLKTVKFSPQKTSYCKIDASTMGDNLNVEIDNAVSMKDYMLNSVPTMAFGKTYSLKIGQNVNVILDNETFSFSKIEAGTDAKITVGNGATLNL